jgi:hypothetical protein
MCIVDNDDQINSKERLILEIERQLLLLYGSPIISSENLKAVLAYGTVDAFRQAIVRKKLPVPLFEMENRRGKFALVKDIATWLVEQRYPNEETNMN